jgi:digeranylgeranylglycerophospholipid reductase
LRKVISYFDVIVIGGGPAGCYAALTASTMGCKVALFEEHNAIGRPRHDPGWLMQSDFTESAMDALKEVVPRTKVDEYRICQAESGALIEKIAGAGYLVMRDILEKAIAALAIRAGVSLYLKTKVVKLVKKEGKVEAVETNSILKPRAYGRVFICADGIRSASHGFAFKEGVCKKGEIRSGVSHLLANADIPVGIIEHFLSPDPSLNYKCLFGHSDGLCISGTSSNEAFNELKTREDNVISKKIKNACAVEVGGFARARSGKYGEYFKSIIKDNILFIGDASGGAGNIHGMIQGKFAGTVAAKAITDNDTSHNKLSEYQNLILNTLQKAPFAWFSAREDFGSFSNWFREFEASTKEIKATELFIASNM